MRAYLITNVQHRVIQVAFPGLSIQRNVSSTQGLLRQNCCAVVQGPQPLLGSDDHDVEEYNGANKVPHTDPCPPEPDAHMGLALMQRA